MENKKIIGNLAAFFSALVWGTTFIFTKKLMLEFNAAEILFTRFAIALIVLTFLAVAKKERLILPENRKDELLFVGAGFTGLFLYGILEIISMMYTYASNTSIIVSTNPFFTAVFTMLILKDEKASLKYFVGFAVAIIGIAIISLNGAKNFGLNPIGDLLALGASVVWGFYTVIIRKAYDRGYSTLYITRRTYIWGTLMMLISLPFFGLNTDLSRFKAASTIVDYLFLGVVASGSCFMTWNLATKMLGAIRSAVYIYIIPVITIVFAALLMGERINLISLVGIAIVLTGTIISTK